MYTHVQNLINKKEQIFVVTTFPAHSPILSKYMIFAFNNISILTDASLFDKCMNQVLRPSKELENLVRLEDDQDDFSQHAIVDICKIYDLNTKDVIK